MCKIGTFQWNLPTIFLKLLNIYFFSKIFQKVKIVTLRWNILQYLTKLLRQYFFRNERLELFLTCFYNIRCYVGYYRISNYYILVTLQQCFCSADIRRTIWYNLVHVRDLFTLVGCVSLIELPPFQKYNSAGRKGLTKISFLT